MSRWLNDDEMRLKYLCEEFRKRRGLRLVGSCKGCSKCCEGNVRVYNFDRETLCVKMIDRQEKECIHFDKETKQCKVHDDDRPVLCVLFPYVPEVLYEGCGYHFEEVR